MPTTVTACTAHVHRMCAVSAGESGQPTERGLQTGRAQECRIFLCSSPQRALRETKAARGAHAGRAGTPRVPCQLGVPGGVRHPRPARRAEARLCVRQGGWPVRVLVDVEAAHHRDSRCVRDRALVAALHLARPL
eukprot:2622169-Pleurochrysis_carterae.AAC.11